MSRPYDLTDIEPRFWPRVDKFGPVSEYAPELGRCWIWTAGKTGSGYGAVAERDTRRPLSAHRVSYLLAVGPIPAGYELDHLCRNPSCVNPAHLEAVTHKENMRRADVALGVRSGRTHCPHGHQYTAENTFNDKRGKRYCRTCQRVWQRRSREKSNA